MFGSCPSQRRQPTINEPRSMLKINGSITRKEHHLTSSPMWRIGLQVSHPDSTHNEGICTSSKSTLHKGRGSFIGIRALCTTTLYRQHRPEQGDKILHNTKSISNGEQVYFRRYYLRCSNRDDLRKNCLFRKAWKNWVS